MKKIVPLLLALAAGCSEPERPNSASFYADNLKDIHRWDPQNGAAGHFAYEGMFIDPSQSVPILIGRLTDMTPSAIYDSLHDPVPVSNIAFHILMRIFSMKPQQFEREGVWIMQSDPSRNPIYMVKFKDEETRGRLARRFRDLAVMRGWMTE